MSGQKPFRTAAGATKSVSATTSTTSTTIPTGGGYNIRLATEIGVGIFIKLGTSGVNATTADGGWDYYLPGGVVEVLGIQPTDTHIAYITASGTNTLYIARGEGL